MKNTPWILLAAIASIALVAFMAWTLIDGSRQRQRPDLVSASRSALPDSGTGIRRIPSEDEVEIGGVIRPKQDVQGPKRRTTADSANRKPLLDVGYTPRIDPRESVHTRAVYEAVHDMSRQLNYRLTPFHPAPKFDRQTYLEDPEAYLSDIAPGRVFDVLPYSPDTPRIRRASSARQKVLQGESVVLKATTEPGMPVSFYSNRLGRFDDGLSAITVAADDQGVARTTFTTTPGMYGDVNIVATSPVRSGKAWYLVEVNLPANRIRKEGP